MTIDWTKPIELSDGTPLVVTRAPRDANDWYDVRLETPAEHEFFKGNSGRSFFDTGKHPFDSTYYVRNRKPRDLQVGDRVRYRFVGPAGSPQRTGRTGTIKRLTGSSATVDWDDGRGAGTPFLYNLELIDMTTTIDTTKPLETNVGDKVTFVTETSDGNLLVDTTPGTSAWIIFDKQGRFVRSQTGSGHALTLRNKVERVVLYQQVAKVTKGYIMSAAFNSEREARGVSGRQVVRVTSENGRVISVDLLD